MELTEANVELAWLQALELQNMSRRRDKIKDKYQVGPVRRMYVVTAPEGHDNAGSMMVLMAESEKNRAKNEFPELEIRLATEDEIKQYDVMNPIIDGIQSPAPQELQVQQQLQQQALADVVPELEVRGPE